jgi:hypothetical protein
MSSTWQRWLLTERLAELCTLASKRDNSAAKDAVSRASMCLEDGELYNATLFCIAAERELVRAKAVT